MDDVDRLIKSINGAFGADSSVINEKRANASVTRMLRFSVEEESYAILRMDDQRCHYIADLAVAPSGS